MKKISVAAYQSLRDALPAVTWYRNQFESLLRTALASYPEVLVGLHFSGDPKRQVADILVDRLVSNERKYRDATIQLMLDIARLSHFPDIERLPEPDRTYRLEIAETAVRNLRNLTREFTEDIAAQEELKAQRKQREQERVALKRFSDELEELKQRYLSLSRSDNPQQRGLEFETLLRDLFNLYDMEPRSSYSTSNEQIDGSLSFDTDDYLMEAKWISDPVGRETVDVFAAKVKRKGKNALGLLIAVNGFATSAIDSNNESTPFMGLDGADLFAVLDQRVRLDDLLKAKRRHANDTGSWFLPASETLTGS